MSTFSQLATGLNVPNYDFISGAASLAGGKTSSPSALPASVAAPITSTGDSFWNKLGGVAGKLVDTAANLYTAKLQTEAARAANPSYMPPGAIEAGQVPSGQWVPGVPNAAVVAGAGAVVVVALLIALKK